MRRRDFLQSAGHLAAAAGLLRFPNVAAAEKSLFRWDRIRPDAWVVFNGGGNVLVIAERDGAIVVDSKLNGMGQLLQAEIESRVGKIAAVVMTHHHDDHSGGYAAFTKTRGIVHAAAVPRIRESAARNADEARKKPKEFTDSLLAALASDFDVPRSAAAARAIGSEVARLVSADPAASVPGEHVSDRMELRVGDTTLELIHAGPAHTDNDMFVRDPKRGIVHAGDLLFHRYHPFIDIWARGNIQGWVAALGAVRKVCDEKTVVVAGHGPTGTRAALEEQTTYFERLRELVSRERMAGRSREEILRLPNTVFPAYGFVGEWVKNLGVAFDELAKR
jgi:glyoxylase-like metal-dependent hydrolase (beta-lactamase superfamily II)